jgi:hypothetical protein
MTVFSPSHVIIVLQPPDVSLEFRVFALSHVHLSKEPLLFSFYLEYGVWNKKTSARFALGNSTDGKVTWYLKPLSDPATAGIVHCQLQ